MYFDATMSERFWSKVDDSGGPDACWPWTGGKFSGKSYGVVRYQYKNFRSNRVAYALSRGPIPEGEVIRHTCDNGECCNPAHLITGTSQDNSNDMVSRGRSARGIKCGNASLTEEEVRQVRDLYAGGGWSQQELGAKFGIHQTAIGQIIRRKTWRHLS